MSRLNMDLFRGKKAILTIPLALGLIVMFLPIVIFGGLAWLTYKKVSNIRLRIILLVCFALLAVMGMVIEVAGVTSDGNLQAPTPIQTQTSTQTAKTATVGIETQALSYKVIQTLNDYGSDKQLLDTTLYAVEVPTFAYDEAKIKTLIGNIKSNECKVDDCTISLFDDEHIAQESYAFDTWPQNKSINDFDVQYPDFEGQDEHHYVAVYYTDRLLFYPLIAAGKGIYDYQALTPTPPSTNTQNTETKSETGSANLYPNPSLTPGEIFNVSAAQVCVSGYSSSVRSVSTSVREQVYAEYGVSYPQSSGTYEVDHFIPLELGGDNSLKNLWLEPANPTPGFHQKDVVENYLHSQVCNGKLSLPDAQNEIKTDWYKVYVSIGSGGSTNTYVPLKSGTTSSSNTSGNTSTSTTAPQVITTPATANQNSATALCNDGTYSYAASHQGACSHHGGVTQFYK